MASVPSFLGRFSTFSDDIHFLSYLKLLRLSYLIITGSSQWLSASVVVLAGGYSVVR